MDNFAGNAIFDSHGENTFVQIIEAPYLCDSEKNFLDQNKEKCQYWVLKLIFKEY